MASGSAARREAALRLPPLAHSGERDPDRPARCYICGGAPGRYKLFETYGGKLMCRDRFACFERMKLQARECRP